MDRDEKIKTVVKKMGRKHVAHPKSTFQYQKDGSRVLDEFLLKRRQAKAAKNRPSQIVSIRKDGTDK